jgi:hypothetical protein
MDGWMDGWMIGLNEANLSWFSVTRPQCQLTFIQMDVLYVALLIPLSGKKNVRDH